MRFDQKFLALNHESFALEFDMNLHTYYILYILIYMYVIYVSFYLFIYLSIYLIIHLSIYVSVCILFLSCAGADRGWEEEAGGGEGHGGGGEEEAYQHSQEPWTGLSIYLSIYLYSIYLFMIYLSVNLSHINIVYMHSIHLSIHLTVSDPDPDTVGSGVFARIQIRTGFLHTTTATIFMF